MNFQLHHIHLLCSDLEKTIAFFTETLGASLVERKKFSNVDGAILDLNGTIVNLRIARDNEKISAGATAAQYGFHHIGLTVDDVEHAYQKLSAKGYVFSAPPKEAGKNKIAFFNGPDNITIELLQSIG